jgi:hypothetical protein
LTAGICSVIFARARASPAAPRLSASLSVRAFDLVARQRHRRQGPADLIDDAAIGREGQIVEHHLGRARRLEASGHPRRRHLHARLELGLDPLAQVAGAALDLRVRGGIRGFLDHVQRARAEGHQLRVGLFALSEVFLPQLADERIQTLGIGFLEGALAEVFEQRRPFGGDADVAQQLDVLSRRIGFLFLLRTRLFVFWLSR